MTTYDNTTETLSGEHNTPIASSHVMNLGPGRVTDESTNTSGELLADGGADDSLDADDVILTGEVGKRHPIETEDGPLCPTCRTLLIEPTHEQDCHTCPSLAYKYDYDKQESYTNPHTAPGGDAA